MCIFLDINLSTAWNCCGLYIIRNTSYRVVFGFGRARRRQAREQSGARAEHKEGLSSDDEETSTDTTSFNLERGNPLIIVLAELILDILELMRCLWYITEK